MRTARRRLALLILTVALAVLASAGPVLACAGLVTPNGNVRLVRTATLAAWHAGNEHYVTAFTFTGGGAEVGSIVPLPAVPSKVERGGDWTLQRLERETQPQPVFATASPPAEGAQSDKAEVVYETRIDALDITILKGGGPAVAEWAKEHGFSLTPDAPEVLDFYAARSPVFMAARFDATAAKEKGQEEGEGTPIHLTIPLEHPWVPLRILSLGRQADESISADVYLLGPERPALLPEPTGGRFDRSGRPVQSGPGDGLVPVRSEWASQSLLDDLRSDKGMEWIPERMWLTYLRVAEEAPELRYDLAINESGTGQPSRVAAGLEAPPAPETTTTTAAPTTTTAAPTTTTAKPKPAPSPTIATAAAPRPAPPAPPAIEPAADPIPVLPEAAPTESEPDVALPAALPIRSDSGGAGPAAVVAAIVGGGLGAGLVAAALRTRLRRRSGA